jgi:plasmid stabilization system protein ParE
VKLQVRAGTRVSDDLRGIARYLRGEGTSREVADHLVNELIDKMVWLGEHHVGRRVNGNLPADYRRYHMSKYIIFYRINEAANLMTVYHVRHGARKPLQPGTHKQMARAAERANFPLTPPRDTSD